MSTEIKKVASSEFEANYQVSGDDLKEAKEKAFKKLASNITIKGFRKGKAPIDLVKERISPIDLANETINQSLNKAYTNVLTENKLEPALRPNVECTNYSEDAIDLKFTIVVQPTCKLGEYKNIEIPLETVKVSKKEVEEAVEKTLKDNSELSLKDGPAEMGDTVIFDFKGYIDGKEFEGGSATNYSLVLGSNQFVPGFEDQLVGVTSESKKDVIVTFPEQYIKDLAGKEAKFVCLIHEIKTKIVPTLDDEFVKSLAIENVDTVEKLKENKKKELHDSKLRDAKNKQFSELLQKIIDGSEFEISDKFLDIQANEEKKNMISQIEQNGISFEQYKEITGLTDATFEEQAKGNVLTQLKEVLVYNEISKAEHLIVTKEEVENYYEQTASRYQMSVENVKKVFAQNENGLVQNIFRNKIENFILMNNLENSDKKEEPAKEETIEENK